MDLRSLTQSALATVDRLRPSAAQIRVYIGGAELLNSTGGRPRVSPLSSREKFTLLPDAGVDTPVIRCRIVGSPDDTIAPSITGKAKWAISYDDGETLQPYRVVTIGRNNTDTAWLVILEGV